MLTWNRKAGRALGFLATLALGTAALPDEKPSMLHTPPEQAPANQPLVVEGSMDNGGSIERVVIRYRGPAEDFTEVAMEYKYGDLYRGVIPAGKLVPPGVEYYIEGVTRSGGRIALFMSSKRPARVFVMGPPGPDAGAPSKESRPKSR